ncbi:MAG TPA: GDSL-type esterase/lipase family protein [Gemmataceae bacterium]|jgi:beta-glucosidase
MISSLFATIAEWVREQGHAFTVLYRKRRPEQRSSPPTVEALETRCLPTSTTTVPALSEIPQPIAQWDIALATQSKGNPLVVFVGDSISWQYVYGTGAAVWAGIMAPLGMSNYGVGGQTTESLLFQFSEGQLIGINPPVVVLDIGANNLLQGNTPQEAADGVLADVNTIHQYLPASHVIVLGILPGRQNPGDPYRSEGAQTNHLVIQMLAGDPKATFVDLGPMFLQPDGTISSSMMFDYLHPTQQGYMDLTNALLPIIEQALLPNFNIPVISAPASPPPSPIALTPQ